jgi:hypothetical protein
MATLVSLVARTIDAMLPALGEIGRDLASHETATSSSPHR